MSTGWVCPGRCSSIGRVNDLQKESCEQANKKVNEELRNIQAQELTLFFDLQRKTY